MIDIEQRTLRTSNNRLPPDFITALSSADTSAIIGRILSASAKAPDRRPSPKIDRIGPQDAASAIEIWYSRMSRSLADELRS